MPGQPQTLDALQSASSTHFRLWEEQHSDDEEVSTALTVTSSTQPAPGQREDRPAYAAEQHVSQVGRTIGNYRLVETLQVGHIHAVYRGVSLVDGSSVAIKTIRLSTKGSAPCRLLQEWHFIRALRHDHVIEARDFFIGERDLYLVLEFLNGPNLEDYVAQRGPLDYVHAAQLLLEAASGLAYSHSQGLTHRDVKPSNFCFDGDGRLKVIDFGVTLDHAALASVTLAHADRLVGTVNYMAPEQALEAHLADERADIYSLGCTLYYLLTGRPPFAQGSAAARLLMHRFDQPDSIHRSRRDAPPALVELCEWMMAKAPEDRPQSMVEVQQSLEAWLAQVAGGPKTE